MRMQIEAKVWVPFAILIFAVVEELNSIWTGTIDYALRLIYYHYNGVMFPNPYGLLWTWTNPLYWTDVPYKLYISCFVIAMAGFQFWLYKTKRLPFAIVILSQFQNSIWCIVGGYQHITMNAWQTLSFWNPLFMGLWVLSEFPIGNSAGAACDFGPNKLAYWLNGGQYQLCGPGLFFGSMGLIIWHFMELAWVVGPALYWFVYRWKIPQRVFRFIKRKYFEFMDGESEHWNVEQ